MQEHEHLNRQAIEAGKHVWSEKPIANALARWLVKDKPLRLYMPFREWKRRWAPSSVLTTLAASLSNSADRGRYLHNNRAAKEWLTGDAPRRLMEGSDVWQTK